MSIPNDFVNLFTMTYFSIYRVINSLFSIESKDIAQKVLYLPSLS